MNAGSKLTHVGVVPVKAAARKHHKVPVDVRVNEAAGTIEFEYEGNPCGTATSELSASAKKSFDAMGFKIAELASAIAVMKEAKEVSAEMMFLDGINYPVEITAKVPKETTVASAAPAAKDYSKLLKDFEANDADEINKRISWLKSNNVAEYAIALFVKMMDGHSNIAPFNPSYIVQGKEVENALSFAYMKGNLLLVGPAGSGKNKFITTFSNLLDLNLIDKSCSAGVDEEGLFGYLSMKPSEDCPSPDAVNRAFKKFIEAISTKVNDNEEFASKFASADVEEQIKTIKTECADEDFSVLFAAMRSNTAQIEFEPSVLTKALEKPSMINLDEVNTLRPTVTSALHSALDNRRNILINGYKNVGIHDNVIFTATMNEGNDYAGTSIMNLAFEDRFHVIEFEAPKDIADILKLEVPTLSNKAIKVLNELYKKLKAVCGTEIQDRSFSLRAFIYAAQNIALGNGIKEGILCTIVPKIRDYEDRETVKGYVDLMLK
jgi:MoxR-like ATPase